MLLDLQAQEAATQVGVLHDLAVGVDPDGADSWIWQEAFADGMTVGAPPDEFNTRGQDWTLPPFDPWRLRSNGYDPWIEALRSGFRHAAGIRVDHVMGMFRLFWIPEDHRPPWVSISAIHGRHAQHPGPGSPPGRRFAGGGGPGTVGDDVRRDLAERQVMSYRVWWFEDDPPNTWPRNALDR